VRVPAGGGRLAAALAGAAAGDVLRLDPGEHAGGFSVDKTVELAGAPGARIVGPGTGRVVTLNAPGATLRGVVVSGSGLDLSTEDAGVFVTAAARGARVVGNRIEGNLIGVYLKGSPDAEVRGNVIVGRQDLRMNERGNGVQIWNAEGASATGNEVRFGRDGIFVTTSKRNRFTGNRFHDLRFAVHYMYTDDSEVSGNLSAGNHIGYAIMYSTGIKLHDNRSVGDRDHGILMNYVNETAIAGNSVTGGAEKCVFIYNTNKNDIYGNRFEGCAIGVHFTAGSERNRIWGNSFTGNRNQVKYVGTRHIEWSKDGHGNYWSDNLAFDMNGDGKADLPYRPNGLVDQIVWRHPLAKLLLNSPAAQILRWAQSNFPALRPGGVVDSHPLMRPEA
jgi:nitrous oxidase accessory protein